MTEAYSIDRSKVANGIVVEDVPELLIPVEPLSGKPARRKLELNGLRREEGLTLLVGGGLMADGFANLQAHPFTETSANLLSALVNMPLISVGVTILIANLLIGEVRDAHRTNIKSPLEL